jgi:hydroxyacylglutathione hydrolase
MVERLRVGPIGENAYIVPLADGRSCALVDPGDEGSRIVAFMDSRGLIPAILVVTHGHLDHTAAIPDILSTYEARGMRIPIAVHRLDAGYFGPSSVAANRELFAAIRALGYFRAYWRPLPPADILLEDGDTLLGAALTVIHTPGHTHGSICIHQADPGFLISGDTLFKEGRGRTDGPDSNLQSLRTSLYRIGALPPHTKVFPGHGDPTSIGREFGGGYEVE